MIFDKMMMKRLTSTLESKKMRHFEASYPVSPEQQRWLTFGAVLFARNGESCRTFRMLADKQTVVKMLDEWWGINSRNEALRVVGYLSLAEGHTLFADNIYENFILKERLDLLSQENIIDYLMSLEVADIDSLGLSGADPDRIIAGLAAYKTAQKVLRDLGYKERELASITTTAAWDYGRTGVIARDSAKAGYLDEDEAWEFMKVAAGNAATVYSDWREYVAGYVCGRALGYGSGSTDIYAVLQYLLESKNSPFNEVSFK